MAIMRSGGGTSSGHHRPLCRQCVRFIRV